MLTGLQARGWNGANIRLFRSAAGKDGEAIGPGVGGWWAM